MNKYKLLPAFLNMFEGGAGTTSGAGEGGAATTLGTGAEGETNNTMHVNTQRAKKSGGKYQNVQFGKQNLDAEGKENKTDVLVTSNTMEDRRKEFLDIINNQYKDIYTQETQRIIDRRFKETKQLQESVNQTQPLVDMLMQKYKIDNNDINKLVEAIENDDNYWEDAAYEAGMSVDQYKEFQKLQRENKQLLQQQQQRQGQQKAQEQLNKWYAEAEALTQQYPDFSLESEVKNGNFISMLKAGVPMEHAYKVIHMDDIVNEKMQSAAATTEKRVIQNIRAKGQRPVENGISSHSAVTIKDDVSKLTKSDRAEIVRRALMGERIEF